MKNLAILGRILFALPFGLMGLNHFIMTNTFIGMSSTFIPTGAYTILIVGAILMLASISIILNKNITLACSVLAFLLLIFIATIHIPGLFNSDIKVAQLALIELLKDTGLLGGTIMFAIFSKSETAKTKE